MRPLNGRKQTIRGLAFTPDSNHLVVGGVAGWLDIWNLSDGSCRSINCKEEIFAFVLDGGGRHAVVSNWEGLAVYDLRRGAPCATGRPVPMELSVGPMPDSPGKEAVVFAENMNETLLASYSLPELRRNWRLAGSDEEGFICASAGPGEGIFTLTDHFDSATQRSNVTLERRSARDGLLLDVIEDHLPALGVSFNIALTADGRWLAAPFSTRLRVWDLTTKEVVANISCGRKHFTSVKFDPFGRFMAGTRNDESVHLWSTGDWRESAAFTWDVGKVKQIAFAPDGLKAAAGGNLGRVAVWDIDA